MFSQKIFVLFFCLSPMKTQLCKRLKNTLLSLLLLPTISILMNIFVHIIFFWGEHNFVIFLLQDFDDESHLTLGPGCPVGDLEL